VQGKKQEKREIQLIYCKDSVRGAWFRANQTVGREERRKKEKKRGG